jgi:hypothetical protein
MDLHDQPKVPLSVLTVWRSPAPPEERRGIDVPTPTAGGDSGAMVVIPGSTSIVDATWRKRVTIAGRVRSVRVAPLHDAPTLELILVDATGSISVVFLGRRRLAGVQVGTKMIVEGTVGNHKARLAILNPSYQLLS